MSKGSGTTRKATGASLPESIVGLINGFNEKGKVYADFSISRQEARELADKMETSYSQGSKWALDHYFDEESYTNLSAALRNNTLSEEQKKVVSALNTEMKPISKTITVYRMEVPGDEHSEIYTSASLNVHRALGYRREAVKTELHAYRIPKGTKAIIAGTIDQEVIFPIGFDLKKYRIL